MLVAVGLILMIVARLVRVDGVQADARTAQAGSCQRAYGGDADSWGEELVPSVCSGERTAS